MINPSMNMMYITYVLPFARITCYQHFIRKERVTVNIWVNLINLESEC